MERWVVGYNKETRKWIIGGVLASYPRHKFDVYVVEAADAGQAESQARTARGSHRTITAGQQDLLLTMLRQLPWSKLDNRDCGDSFHLPAAELALAKALAKKGLLDLAGGHTSAKLTPSAFNLI